MFENFNSVWLVMSCCNMVLNLNNHSQNQRKYLPYLLEFYNTRNVCRVEHTSIFVSYHFLPEIKCKRQTLVRYQLIQAINGGSLRTSTVIHFLRPDGYQWTSKSIWFIFLLLLYDRWKMCWDIVSRQLWPTGDVNIHRCWIKRSENATKRHLESCITSWYLLLSLPEIEYYSKHIEKINYEWKYD